MKKEVGISMIEVIISIIILLILAFLAIFMSKDAVPQAKLTEVYAEMKAVKQAVSGIKTDMVMNANYSLQEGIHYDAAIEGQGGYYILYGSFDTSHSMAAAKNLGLEDLKRNYIISYETGEIELETPIDIQGTKVKTMSEVKDLLDSGAIE